MKREGYAAASEAVQRIEVVTSARNMAKVFVYHVPRAAWNIES